MNSEETKLKNIPPNQQSFPTGPVNNPPVQPTVIVVPAAVGIIIPFNVAQDLNMFTRIFVVREFDKFKIFHYYERLFPDYKVFGELPDGDKKLLFTSSRHFQCCKCCDNFSIDCCFATYFCCDSIVFQMDYKRNGAPFYTQGLNIAKGCYCCKCGYCCYCCPPSILFLRENVEPENPNPKVGIQKGSTEVPNTCCCSCCRDKTVFYNTQEGFKGPLVRAKCCDICKHRCIYHCCFNCTCDFEMDIEDEKGAKVGNIMIYSGCYSEKVVDKCCYYPAPYYEINMPTVCTSEQKFQIIADIIHFDLVYNVV